MEVGRDVFLCKMLKKKDYAAPNPSRDTARDMNQLFYEDRLGKTIRIVRDSGRLGVKGTNI